MRLWCKLFLVMIYVFLNSEFIRASELFQRSNCSTKNFIYNIDILCLRAFEDGLNQVQSPQAFANPFPSTDIAFIVNRAKKTSSFQWRPGLRIGTKYSFQELELNASYIYYYTQLINNYSYSNKFNSKLNINILDFTAGRTIAVSSNFAIRPYGGLRTALFYQKVLQSLIIKNRIPIHLTVKDKYWSIGPIIGFEGLMPIGNSFEIFANLGTGLLFAHFNDIFHERNGRVFLKSRQRHHLEQLVADISAGIQWKKSYQNIDYALKIALEHHRFFFHNQIDLPGDLSLTGLSFGTLINF